MSGLSMALGGADNGRGADETSKRSIVDIPKSSTTDTLDMYHSPPTSGLLRQRTGSTSTDNSRKVSPSLGLSAKRHSLNADAGTPPSSYDQHHHNLVLSSSSPKPLPLHVPNAARATPPIAPTTAGSPLPSLSSLAPGSASSFSNSGAAPASVLSHSSSAAATILSGSSPSSYHHPQSLAHRASPSSGVGPISANRHRYSNSSTASRFKNSPSTSLLSAGASVPSSLQENDHLSSLAKESYRSSTGGPLNANSPLALAAAAQVTPDKLSRLLLTQGPLAIRHITSHLALTITGFADLSSSKQRRLIIAVLDSGDSVNNVIFEKISWGRWAARKVDHKLLSKQVRRQSISSAIHTPTRPPVSPVLKPHDGSRPSSFIRRASSNTLGKSGLSSWAVDDVDLADDDMMFHNSTEKIRGKTQRRIPGQVFDDDIDDVAVVSDEDEDEDDDEDESDDFGYPYRKSGASSSFSRPVPLSASAKLRMPTTGAESFTRKAAGDTDEEDWQSVGAEGLRGNPIPVNKREQEAIDALVQLRSI